MKVSDCLYVGVVVVVGYFVLGCTATLRLDSNESESKVVSYREPVESTARGNGRFNRYDRYEK